jgi:hypothetical protein
MPRAPHPSGRIVRHISSCAGFHRAHRPPSADGLPSVLFFQPAPPAVNVTEPIASAPTTDPTPAGVESVVGEGLPRVGGGSGVKVNLASAPPARMRRLDAVDGVAVRVGVVRRLGKR